MNKTLIALAAAAVLMPLAASAATPAPSDPAFTQHPDLDPEFDGYSNGWTGAFVGLGAFGGVAWLGNSGMGDDLGWTAGVLARMNLVLSLFDFQIDYRYSRFNTTWRDTPIGLDHHAVGAALGVHPLFLLNLGGNRVSYALAAFYLQVGVTLDVTGVTDTRQGKSASDVDWGLNVGFGGDFPVTDPDAGNSLWIGALYRFSKTAVEVAPLDGLDLAEHITVVNLTLRHNGLLF